MITAQIIPIVLQCERCGEFHHPAVRFMEDEAPTIKGLPMRCRCGESLHTDSAFHLCVATARNLVETSHIVRGEQ